MPRTARSSCADGATMAALLPPSSRIDRPNRPATTGPTCWPIAVDPVALISGTPVCATSAAPVVRVAEQHLVQVRRCIDLRGRLFEQRVRGQRRERCQLARLPDDRVAAHQGERGVPRPHRDGEVERGDHADRADRVPLLHQPVAGAFRRDRQPVQLAAQPDGEVADVDHLLHLAECLALDLAGLELHQSGEVGLVLAQHHAQSAHQFAAHRGGRGAPHAVRLGRPIDRAVDVVVRARPRPVAHR